MGVRFTPSADGDPTLFSSLGSGLTYEWNDLNGDRRWQPGEEGTLLGSSMLSQRAKDRVAPGGIAAVGVLLSAKVSLRLETAFVGDYVTTIASQSSSFLQSVEGQDTLSATDFTVAAGWHQGGLRRTTIAYLGGVVFRRARHETLLTTTYRSLNTISPTGSTFTTLPFAGGYDQRFASTSYTTGVTAGVDVAIEVASHVAVVPQVRFVAFDQDWSLRPAVVLRWRP